MYDASNTKHNFKGLIKMAVETNVSVYRYKLEPHIVDAVTRFAKVHEYDTRADYKEAWKKWCDEEREMIEIENRRLMELGYDGDVIDKMYKSGRYYFRNKKINKDNKPQMRRHYIAMDNVILDAMDRHIESYHELDEFTPAQGYDWFVNEYRSMLIVEIRRLLNEEPELQASYIQNKIKKTYKNRYYLFANKN